MKIQMILDDAFTVLMYKTFSGTRIILVQLH